MIISINAVYTCQLSEQRIESAWCTKAETNLDGETMMVDVYETKMPKSTL